MESVSRIYYSAHIHTMVTYNDLIDHFSGKNTLRVDADGLVDYGVFSTEEVAAARALNNRMNAVVRMYDNDTRDVDSDDAMDVDTDSDA